MGDEFRGYDQGSASYKPFLNKDFAIAYDIVICLKDAGSPVLINDLADKNSFHVVMPMKI